jgi:hypothetical protein
MNRNTQGKDFKWLDRELKRHPRRLSNRLVEDSDGWEGAVEIDGRYFQDYVDLGVRLLGYHLQAESRMDAEVRKSLSLVRTPLSARLALRARVRRVYRDAFDA